MRCWCSAGQWRVGRTSTRAKWAMSGAITKTHCVTWTRSARPGTNDSRTQIPRLKRRELRRAEHRREPLAVHHRRLEAARIEAGRQLVRLIANVPLQRRDLQVRDLVKLRRAARSRVA